MTGRELSDGHTNMIITGTHVKFFWKSMVLQFASSHNQFLCTPIKKTYPLASLKSQEPLCRGAKKGYVL